MASEKTKSVLKSIRLSEDVYGYIMQQPGDNFSDKFEGLIREVREGESSRKKVLQHYDKKIEEATHRLYAVSGRLAELERIALRVTSVSDAVDKLVVAVDMVLEGGVLPPAPGGKL